MHMLLILWLEHSTCYLLTQVPLVQPACPHDVSPFSAACAEALAPHTLFLGTLSFPVITLLKLHTTCHSPATLPLLTVSCLLATSTNSPYSTRPGSVYPAYSTPVNSVCCPTHSWFLSNVPALSGTACIAACCSRLCMSRCGLPVLPILPTKCYRAGRATSTTAKSVSGRPTWDKRSAYMQASAHALHLLTCMPSMPQSTTSAAAVLLRA